MKLKDILYSFLDGYYIACVMVVTVIVTLLFLFGGTVAVEINFNSWNELIERIKNR